jgi:hypothetical protein
MGSVTAVSAVDKVRGDLLNTSLTIQFNERKKNTIERNNFKIVRYWTRLYFVSDLLLTYTL